MVNESSRTQAMEFLRGKVVAVISTVSQDNKPESATIYFDVDENFCFYFMTKNFTRKFANLETNPEVSLVVGTENVPVTVQVQGTVEKIEDEQTANLWLEKIRKRFFQNDYVAPLFQLHPEKNEVVLFKITPSWIRMLDQRDPHQNSTFFQVL